MKLSSLLILILLSAPLAHGEGVKEEARAHVARATELHEASKFREALDELKTAYALDPDPPLLYAMGQLHVSLGECDQAIAFYERFLASKPSARSAALAHQAIEICKTNPPPPIEAAPADEPARAVISRPVIEVAVPPSPPPPRTADAPTARPWYSDHVANVLVGSGVVTGVVSLLVYRSAVGDRERANTTASYDSYASLIERAHTKRAYAIGLGVGGAALATAGVLHFVLRGRQANDHGLQIQPSRSGAAMSWVGRF
jgi:tetratricopeptide (TPR) repeat protein